MDKTEGYPIGLGRNFGRSNIWTNPLAKVVDFVPLEALFCSGAPDSNLIIFGYVDTRKFAYGYEREREFSFS